MSEQTPRTIAVYSREYYETTIYREPVELNLDNYPELEGLTREEAIEYVESNAWEMKPTNDDSGYDCLADQINDMDISRDRIKNESQEIIADLEMF